MLPTIALPFAALLSTVLAGPSVVTHSKLSNSNTSLRILYQNNLNYTDDVNHLPFLLLDATSGDQASSACAAFNETLITSQQLSAYSSDFQKLFAYLEYTNSGNEFHIQDATVHVSNDGSFHVTPNKKNALPVMCSQSQASQTPAASNEITIASGSNTFTGFRSPKAFTFLGIPFADKPTRFQYPTIYSGENKNIQALAFGPQCIQYGSGSEDCLFLNIYSPYIPKAGCKDNLRPVMFWIHGGGFTGGNGQTDGSQMASREDVLFVSIQYRLSTLGFLAAPNSTATGNFGIADQIAALKWVRANIASFGGDPDQIMIVGQSAGAGSARVMLGSPEAIGNYRAAIAMSNLGGGVDLGLYGDYSTTYSSYYTIDQSYVQTKALFSEAGCNQTTIQEQVDCLSEVSAATLTLLPTVARYVVQDGKIVNTEQLIVNADNSSTAHVPVMFGNVADDGASIISYDHSATSISDGLQHMLYISEAEAQSVINSGLFPDPNTGNITLDAFNVSARVYTDAGFRCVDQATVFAGRVSNAFPNAYYYQFDRTIGGYDPNNVGNPPPSPGYPLGNPNLPYFKVHSGGVESAFGLAGPSQIRAPSDLYFEQLVSGYWASFARSLDPNPDLKYLEARGYNTTLQAVENTPWKQIAAGSTAGPIQRLNWPPSAAPYLEQEQCKFLNYSLSYYLDSNRG